MSKRRRTGVAYRIWMNDRVYVDAKLMASHALEIDPEYQRRIDLERVEKMVEEFDPCIVNPLKVSHREGRYYVFDGGHTLMMLKKVNKGKASFLVECRVYENLTREEEALLFAKQRGLEKPVPFRNRLNANLIGKDEKAETLVKATEDGGLSLAVMERRDGTIWAVEKANSLLEKYGEEHYGKTLSLIKATWGGVQESLAANMLGGVAAFLKEFGERYDRDRFIKKLRDMQPKQIQTLARRNKASYQNMDESYATEIAIAYNKGHGKCRLDHTCVVG